MSLLRLRQNGGRPLSCDEPRACAPSGSRSPEVGPCFVAFDLLFLNGKDVRHERLIDRKLELRRVLGQAASPVIYADHVDGAGVALFKKACERDLEGIVAKHKHSPYAPESESTWFKIRNRSYSQWAGRNALFERERHQEPVAGWHTCTLAAAG